MKKLVQTLILILAVGGLTAFAGPVASSSNNTFGYKSADNELTMNIQREAAEVKFKVSLKNATNYQYMVVEKSTENPNAFDRCSYISCNPKNTSFATEDKTPYVADKDVYYRIKTVNKQGVEKIYPPVLVPAAK